MASKALLGYRRQVREDGLIGSELVVVVEVGHVVADGVVPAPGVPGLREGVAADGDGAGPRLDREQGGQHVRRQLGDGLGRAGRLVHVAGGVPTPRADDVATGTLHADLAPWRGGGQRGRVDAGRQSEVRVSALGTAQDAQRRGQRDREAVGVVDVEDQAALARPGDDTVLPVASGHALGDGLGRAGQVTLPLVADGMLAGVGTLGPRPAGAATVKGRGVGLHDAEASRGEGLRIGDGAGYTLGVRRHASPRVA
jgi:hypothetical protein